MQTYDELCDVLDLMVDDFSDEGNWRGVVAAAAPPAAPGRALLRLPRPRAMVNRRFVAGRGAIRLAAAAAVIAVAAFSAMSLAPAGGQKGCSAGVLACASAAIGNAGPVIHMTVGMSGPASTQDNPYPDRGEVWLDSETHESHFVIESGGETTESWTLANGDRYLLRNGNLSKLGNAADEVDPFDLMVASFGSFQKLVDSRKAVLAGTTVFEGRKVDMIDLPLADVTGPTGATTKASERVLVDAQSYEPVGAGMAVTGGRWIPFFTDPRALDAQGYHGYKLDVEQRIDSAAFEARSSDEFQLPGN